MPQYFFYCPNKNGEGWKHVTPRVASIHKIPKSVKCESCGKRATLGLAPTMASFELNRRMSDKTKRDYRWAFGKKKASKMETTADVDAALMDFTRRYPHLAPGYVRGRSYDLNSTSDMASLGMPGDRLADPFPTQDVTEERRNNTSADSRR